MEGENLKFFEMPGLQDTVKRFKALLKVSEKFDHVLIRGPRGVGKSFFLKIFKECYPKLLLPVTHKNCATIHPDSAESELFGHVKGAYTGADKDRKGFLLEAAENGGVIILEEFNSLRVDIQAKLLVFMELYFFHPLGTQKRTEAQVRIVCTMNFESDLEVRLDVLDRFRVVLDVPPLSMRRSDIFSIIDGKFPELNLSNLTILILFAHNWPGNIRQLEQALFEYKATGSFPPDVVNNQYKDHLGDVFTRLVNVGVSEANIARFFPVYLNEIISYLREPFKGMIVPPSDLLPKKRKPDDTISSFFQLIYGKRSIISKEHILTLKPFSNDSLVAVKSERERIIGRKITRIMDIDTIEEEIQEGRGLDEPQEKIDVLEIEFSECKNLDKQQEENDAYLKVLAACKKVCAIEEANRKKPETNELTPNQVAEYLVGSPDNYPAVLKSMLSIKKQNRISDIIGISTTTMNNWAKAIGKGEWPPNKKLST